MRFAPGIQPSYYNVMFALRAGGVVAQVNQQGAGPIHGPIVSFAFSFYRNGGCGEAKVVLKKDALQGSPVRGNLLTIGVYLPDGAGITYKGTVVETPVYTTEDTVEYLAYGYWMQAEKQHIVKYYEGKDVDDMVIDILADIDTPNSDINAAAGEISIAAPYTVGDFEAEYITAAAAIKMLATIQGNVEYGITNTGRLYFRDRVTTVGDLVFYEGQHFTGADIRERSDQAVNRVFLRSKEIVGGGQLTLNRDDVASTTSIANIGVRSAVVNVPHFKTHADVWRFGLYYLAERGATEVSDFQVGPFIEGVWPSGNIEVREADGTSIGEYPIDSVHYSYGPDGFQGVMKVGDEPAPRFDDEMRSIIRTIENERSTSLSNVKIDHSRGEEWAQDLIINARKNDQLNQFYDTFGNTKALDLSLCRRLYHQSRQYYVGCSQDAPTGGVIVSNSIPTGEEFDSVRVFLDVDIDGTILFEQAQDFKESFVQGLNWQLHATNARAVNEVADTFLELIQTQWRPYANTGYTIEFAFDNVGNVFGNPFEFDWDRIGGNNYNFITIVNQAGPNRTTIDLHRMIAGVPTVSLGTITGTWLQNMRVEIVARNLGPPNTVITAWDKTTGILIGTVNTALLPLTTGQLAGPDNWYGTPILPNVAQLDWIKPDTESGSMVVSVSRDNGTTWTSVGAVLDGQNVYDVNIAAQPAGTQLRLKLEVDWPSRLYGWGVAF